MEFLKVELELLCQILLIINFLFLHLLDLFIDEVDDDDERDRLGRKVEVRTHSKKDLLRVHLGSEGAYTNPRPARARTSPSASRRAARARQLRGQRAGELVVGRLQLSHVEQDAFACGRGADGAVGGDGELWRQHDGGGDGDVVVE